MIDEAKFRELKRRAEEAQTARDKAQGQLESTMKRMKEEFGCSSIKEAETKLKSFESEAEKAEKEFKKAVNNFEEKWDDRLDSENS